MRNKTSNTTEELPILIGHKCQVQVLERQTTTILFSIFVFIKYFLEAGNHKRINFRAELVDNQLGFVDVQDSREVQQGEDTDPVPPLTVTRP